MSDNPRDIRKRINKVIRIATDEGREDDPHFLDWVESQEQLIDEYRTARWYVEEIQLGSGSFGT